MIVEEEQDGEARAKYGQKLLVELSKRLKKRFEKGFSETTRRKKRILYKNLRATTVANSPCCEPFGSMCG